jgi:hypothetical protein
VITRVRSLASRAGRALADGWFAPAPASRLAAMRILAGLFAIGYLLARGNVLWRLSAMPRRDFVPVGLARLVDGPLDPTAHHAIVLATAVLALAFTAGVLHRLLAPLFALGLLWLLGYRSSWGMLFHTDNLLVLHVAVLALAPASDAWSADAWWRGRHRLARLRADARTADQLAADAPALPSPSEAYGWPLKLMAAVTALTYLIAGVAKLKLGGLAWAEGVQLREQVAIDNVRKALLGSPMSPLAAPMLHHDWAFSLMALTSLVVELGAPLALLHRRVAAVWALAAWGFHAGVVALMAILFPYPLLGLAYAPLFAVERPVGWLGRTLARAGRLVRRRRGPPLPPLPPARALRSERPADAEGGQER